MQISRECTPPYLSTGISNLLQPAQAEVELGQLSRYLASWTGPVRSLIYCSISIILLASLVAGRKPQCTAGAEKQGMCSTIPVPDWKGQGQPACQKEWKKCKEENE